MKKQLFLLTSFMATSLVIANTLLVISCKAKAIKDTTSDGKDDDKSTEMVANEKSKELKGKIRNIIDGIIANPNVEDWLIDLKEEFKSNYNDIISKLNTAVETLRASQTVEKQQMLLANVPLLEKKFIDKVNEKFANLKDLIIGKINELDDIDTSNLEFDLSFDSIEPKLTTLNGKQVIEAVAILETKENTLSDSSNSMSKNLNYDATSEKKLELFKVKTNLKYNFKIAGKTFEGNYNDVELLLTGNSDTYQKKYKYTQDAIADILAKYKNIKIYGTNEDDGEDDGLWVVEKQQPEYISKQMDWDFSKISVKNEIQGLQFERFQTLKRYDPTLKENLKFKSANRIDFELDSSNYMKFSNHDIDLRRSSADNILVKESFKDLTNAENEIKEAKDANKSLKKQFFSDNKADLEDWNGGKINHDFMEQVKKDSKKESNAEEKKPRIDLNEFYGLGGEKETNDMLIGYGTTTIKGVSYAGMPLSSISLDTNITASFDPGFESLFADLRKYVEIIVDALVKTATMRIGKSDYESYYFEWQFTNPGEFDIIKDEVTKPDSDKTITFDWMMDNVLKDKRILGGENAIKNAFEGITGKIPKNAWSFLRSVNEIKYKWREQDENDENLFVLDDFRRISASFYLKYGPFVVYLAGDDLWTVYGKDEKLGVVGRHW